MRNKKRTLLGALLFVSLGTLYLWAADDAKVKLTDAAGTSKFAVQDSGAVSVMTVDSNGKITSGVASAETGGLALYNSASANATTLQAGNATSAVVYTLPTADAASSGQVLSSNTTGTLSWVTKAPFDAQYVALAADATLTNERVLTPGQGINIADGGAGAAVTVRTAVPIAYNFVGPIRTTVANWLNMPAAATEMYAATNAIRTQIDMTYATDVRAVVRTGNIAGAAGAVLYFEYSANQVAWVNLGIANTAINAANTTTTSAWTAVPVGAKGDMYVHVMGSGGDGAIDPDLKMVQLQFR